MTTPQEPRYFFDDGIRFQCRQCGICCTGAPGIVRVSAEEAGAIAALLDISVSRFEDTYLRPIKGGQSLREDDDGRCVFYRDGCRIYPVRPHQCRTYPFWFSAMRSEARWQQVVRQCPGIGQGRLFARDEILDILGTTFG